MPLADEMLAQLLEFLEDKERIFDFVKGAAKQLLSARAVTVAIFATLALRLFRVRRRLGAIGHVPGGGIRVLLDPLFPMPLPAIPLLIKEPNWWSSLKHSPFAQEGTDVLATASLLPPRVTYILADPVAVKEVHRSRATFIKPPSMYEMLNIFGVNIVTAEGLDYRRHRAPVQGSFTERNNRMVWNTSVALAQMLLESPVWAGKDVVEMKESVDVTAPFALSVLKTAAFGRPITEKRDTAIPPGHVMPFEEAVEVVSSNLITRVLVPTWARRLTAGLRRVDDACNDVTRTAQELIAERRVTPDEDKDDLFSSLIRAADLETDAKNRLNDDDLVADVIAFLVAGHETTAHTLAITLGMLALHPEEQQYVYEEVQSHSDDGQPPAYEEAHKLHRCLAVIHETLRLYPPAPRTSKESTVDTMLPLAFPSRTGATSVVVPKGTIVTTHVVALHYNPRYWPEPHLFRSARFLDPSWPRDAFAPFSGGARICIGKRFAETEAVALLAVLIQRYTIELGDAVKERVNGITDERTRREKAVTVIQGLTLVPTGLPLVFRRRVV